MIKLVTGRLRVGLKVSIMMHDDMLFFDDTSNDDRNNIHARQWRYYEKVKIIVYIQMRQYIQNHVTHHCEFVLPFCLRF